MPAPLLTAIVQPLTAHTAGFVVVLQQHTPAVVLCWLVELYTREPEVRLLCPRQGPFK